MRGVARGARDVNAELSARARAHVQGGDHTAGMLDSAGDLADRAAVRRYFEPHCYRVGDTRSHGHLSNRLSWTPPTKGMASFPGGYTPTPQTPDRCSHRAYSRL